MTAHGEILDKVSQLSAFNVELAEEIALLEEARDDLELRFETNLSDLNKAIYELPVVIDVLILEKPPPLQLTFTGGLLNALWTVVRLKKPQPTLGAVQAVMAKICGAEVEMQAAQKGATEKKIATADLACKTAEHIERCSSACRTVTDAQTQTQCSLDTAKRRIESARQEISNNNRMSEEMANKARQHDQRVEGNKLLFWTTCWIPIVNIVTIPVAMCLEAENKNLAASFRAVAANLEAEIATKTAEQRSLEATRSELDVVLQKLNLAYREAEERARHATELRDQAKVNLDRYGIISTRVRDVLKALDFVGDGGNVSAEGWDQARFLGLHALKGMLITLRERGLLASECFEVAERMESLTELEKGGRGLEELEF
ncbi:hypothetical protein QBC43DRAFT_293175 [Cladorrhinum sp. PSN259]|nr:hypothetical protein QBC43DRAFT_293175 [Cladorrhinum sp. PSN259]